jgi:hypothetical protein
MQPFNKLTFNALPNSSAANDTARSTFSNESSQVHLPRTKQAMSPDLWMLDARARIDFFVSSWVWKSSPVVLS